MHDAQRLWANVHDSIEQRPVALYVGRVRAQAGWVELVGDPVEAKRLSQLIERDVGPVVPEELLLAVGANRPLRAHQRP